MSASTPKKTACLSAAPADVMLSKKELAPKLKVSVRTIENWQHEGYLPFIKIANVVMFYWPTVRRVSRPEQRGVARMRL